MMSREHALTLVAVGGLANQIENVEGLPCKEITAVETYTISDGLGTATEQDLPYLWVGTDHGVEGVVVWSPLTGWIMGPDLEDLMLPLHGVDVFELAAEVASNLRAI